MTRLANWFVQAGTILGRPIEADFTLLLGDVRKLVSVVRVSGVGSENGMLIFDDYEAIREDVAELAALGYGFSVMDEPRSDKKFDLESFEEMFTDWAGRATQV